MYQRHLLPFAYESLRETRGLLIHGARQVGNRTFARQLFGPELPATYVLLDDFVYLDAGGARSGGVQCAIYRPGHPRSSPVIIDEVQRAPEIFLPI